MMGAAQTYQQDGLTCLHNVRTPSLELTQLSKHQWPSDRTMSSLTVGASSMKYWARCIWELCLPYVPSLAQVSRSSLYLKKCCCAIALSNDRRLIWDLTLGQIRPKSLISEIFTRYRERCRKAHNGWRVALCISWYTIDLVVIHFRLSHPNNTNVKNVHLSRSVSCFRVGNQMGRGQMNDDRQCGNEKATIATKWRRAGKCLTKACVGAL